MIPMNIRFCFLKRSPDKKRSPVLGFPQCTCWACWARVGVSSQPGLRPVPVRGPVV